MDTLTYRGNCGQYSHELMGPDWDGAYYVPCASFWDPATGMTTIFVRPIPPAELTHRRDQILGRIAERARIVALFKGATRS
jgi:hypothetical protein